VAALAAQDEHPRILSTRLRRAMLPNVQGPCAFRAILFRRVGAGRPMRPRAAPTEEEEKKGPL
jgi:hypothetical protein